MRRTTFVVGVHPARLPLPPQDLGITIFTVSHRAALKRHHDFLLQLDGRGDWTFQQIDHEEAGNLSFCSSPMPSPSKTAAKAGKAVKSLVMEPTLNGTHDPTLNGTHGGPKDGPHGGAENGTAHMNGNGLPCAEKPKQAAKGKGPMAPKPATPLQNGAGANGHA